MKEQLLQLGGSGNTNPNFIDPNDGVGVNHLILASPGASAGITYFRVDNLDSGAITTTNVTSSVGGSPTGQWNGGMGFDRTTKRFFTYRNDIGGNTNGVVYQYDQNLSSAHTVLTGYPDYSVVRGFGLSKNAQYAISISRADTSPNKPAYIFAIPPTNDLATMVYAATGSGQANGACVASDESDFFAFANATGTNYLVSRNGASFSTYVLPTTGVYTDLAFSPKGSTGKVFLASTTGTTLSLGVVGIDSYRVLTIDVPNCVAVSWTVRRKANPDLVYLVCGLSSGYYITAFSVNLDTEEITQLTTLPSLSGLGAAKAKGLKCLQGLYPDHILIEQSTNLTLIRNAYTEDASFVTTSPGITSARTAFVIE